MFIVCVQVKDIYIFFNSQISVLVLAPKTLLSLASHNILFKTVTKHYPTVTVILLSLTQFRRRK